MAKRIDQFNLPYRPNLSVAKEKVDSLFGLMNLMDTQQIKQFSMINNVPLNVDDVNGENLIHKAINTENILKKEFHRLNIIKFLVQNGVNPDKPNKDNQTPLHLACKYQFADIVEYLISLGVNLNYQDNYGAAPFHYALQGRLVLMEPSRELKELIQKPKKIDEEKRQALIEIKKKVWDLIKDSPFISSIKNTIDSSIYSDKKIKDRTIEFYSKAAKTSTNVGTENYIKTYKESIEILRNSIDSTVKSKWNDFPELRNIDIHEKDTNSLSIDSSKFSHLKDINIKDQLKETIVRNKEELKTVCSNIETGVIRKLSERPEENLYKKIGGLYKSVISDNIDSFTLKTIGPTTGPKLNIYVKDTAGNLPNFEQIQKDNLHPLSYDMADNVIDWESLSFYGGSRNPNVVYDISHTQFLIDLDSIEKKVFYILINTPTHLPQVNSLNTVDISGSLAKILAATPDPNRHNFIHVAYKFIFEQDLSELRTQITNVDENKFLIKWLERLDKKDISKATLFYGLITQAYQDNDLNVGLMSHVLNLTSAIHYSDKNNMSLEDALNNSLKKYLIAEILNDVITGKSINEKIHASVNVLLSDKLVSNLADYFQTTTNNDILTKIGDLSAKFDKEEKINIYSELQKMIMDKISLMKAKPMEYDIVNLLSYINKSCFNEKQDACDTIYYKINNLPDIDTLFGGMEIRYTDDIANKILHLIKATNNTILVQYIYLLLELSYTDDSDKASVKPYLLKKLKEANHLGLYFNGCIPNLRLPSRSVLGGNIINAIDLKHPTTNRDITVLLFQDSHKFKDATNLIDINIPLIGNYVKLQPGQTLDTVDKKLNYYPYISGRYRPPIYNENQAYDPIAIKSYRDRKSLFRVLHKLLYTGEDQKNLYSAIDSNSKLGSVFTDYYPLISLLNDLINMDEVRSSIRTLISSLNNYNANILLYYYIFSKDNLYKVPKFNYYEIPQDKGKFLYFDLSGSSIDLNKDITINPTDKESVINSDNSEYLLDNIGRYKTVYSKILQNLVVGKYQINKDALVKAKQSGLPPSLKPVLADFYKYNLINLLVEVNPSIQTLVDEVHALNLFEDDSTKLFNKTISTNYILSKLIEELVKEQMKYYIQTQTYRIIKTQFETKVSTFDISGILLQPTDFELKLNDTTFTEDDLASIDKNYLISAIQLSKEIEEVESKFIIYPEEYANSEILRSKYELIINDKSYSKILEENANPYILDANNQSAIYPVLKLHNFEIISKLKTNLDFRVYNDIEGNLTAYGFLVDEFNNHINKISGGKKYFSNWLENFVLYQKNEIKTLILSNDKFGNNIPRYLEESFNVICYLTNQYLSESIYKIENVSDKDSISYYLGVKHIKFDEYLYANKIMSKLDIYEKDEDNIIEDILENLTIEESKLTKKINKLNPGKTKDKFDKMRETIRDEKTAYENLISGSLFDKLIPKKVNDTKIISRYFELSASHIVLPKILVKLVKDDSLQNSCDILTLKSLNNELGLFSDKNRPPLPTHLEPISKFYENTNKISDIYFTFGKYCDGNKVLAFVRDLLIFMTIGFINSTYYNLLFKILRIYFKTISPNDDDKMIFDKVNYCLKNDTLKGNKSIHAILFDEIATKLVLNSVQIFNNQDEEFSFTQQSTKELLDSVTDLLTVNPVLAIPSDSPLMRNTIKEINAYFDTFTNKTILNWLVVIENVFKFNINQGRIIQSIDKLLN